MRLPSGPPVRIVPAEFPLMLPVLVEELPTGPGWLFELGLRSDRRPGDVCRERALATPRS